MSKRRILFGASYSAIEPLGLLHLGGLARDIGWEREYSLIKNHDFGPFFEKVKEYKPDVIGFNVYTGNHLQLHSALERLRKDNPKISVVAGGPHATYFPSETLKFADFVVMSEGYGGLKEILDGKASPGILPLFDSMRFPQPDREKFYEQYPEHKKSGIKSVITMTGCPYDCSYCYNSSKPATVSNNMPSNVANELVKKLGPSGRLFPKNVRSVDDVVIEGREIAEKWPETKVIYFQDDVHGFDTKKWMPEFASRWKQEVDIPYHAQMRWEMTRQLERLDLLVKGGCFGLTLAIEAANPEIRAEVLDRKMPTQLMFEGMKSVIDRGLRVRTEQITGLPYGATSLPTPINLDADLELVELNVRLRKESGGPTMAWASTLAPYKGTNMGEYCKKFGFYEGDNSDVPDTFFDKSVLRFLKNWVGLNLEQSVRDDSVWLDESELERYRSQNAELRRIFNFVTLVPEGHKLAKKYLESEEAFSYHRLGQDTINHLEEIKERDIEANNLFNKVTEVKSNINKLSIVDFSIIRDMKHLAPYFACIPKYQIALEKVVNYSKGNSKISVNGVDKTILSTAIRHHLYDNVLYSVEGENPNIRFMEYSNPSKI